MKKLKIYTLIVAFVSVFTICGTYFLQPNKKQEQQVEQSNVFAIWGDVTPGNSSNSKLDAMKIDPLFNLDTHGSKFSYAIVGDTFDPDCESYIDSFTYQKTIAKGYAKDTFEDMPTLTAYLVDDSDSAVIVVPGGAYCYKECDESGHEGEEVALALNKKGINAFVLWYRSNPYEMPIPLLDLQRAIRFVKHNSNMFHIDANKIGLVGYSAGGNLVASFVNQAQGKDLFPSGYTKDAIDAEDDSVCNAALIYPVLTFDHNVNMLFAAFGSNTICDEQERELLLDNTNLIEHFNSSKTPQFVAYSADDTIASPADAAAYVQKAKEQNTQIEELCLLGLGHGFATKHYFAAYANWLSTQFA